MPDHARSDDAAVQYQLDRFAQLSPGRDILGLERISALMAALGNPHRKLPPVFHVAGTNGKGSTCTFLRTMLEAAGYSVHVYTSPHLVRFNERIRLSGRLIEDAMLAALLAEVLDVAEAQNIGPSFFEATTATAFLAFARTPADACIIEVGLGGRLDATNIIETPLVCGIAQLGVDHQAFLGDDPVVIAGEKAGIAKRSVPLVTMDYPPEIAARIAGVAQAAGADWVAIKSPSRLREGLGEGILGPSLTHPRPLPPAGGEVESDPGPPQDSFQADNAALAVAMLRAQSVLKVDDDAITLGLANAHWPARMQRLTPGPLVAQGREVWLDGCHNPAAAERVAAAFAGGPPLHLITGILANKDAAGILAPFAAFTARLTALPVPGHDHYPPLALARLARELGIAQGDTAPDIATALADTRPETRTLIIGSLYLAGEVLRLNNQVPE